MCNFMRPQLPLVRGNSMSLGCRAFTVIELRSTTCHISIQTSIQQTFGFGRLQGGLEGCAAAKRLEDSLNLERETCEDFLFAVTDDLFTPWQEATCEVFSYPWHLDMLAICNELAAQHQQSTVSAH